MALEADDPIIRWHAARALGAVGPGGAAAVPKLAAALADKDYHVRSHAAQAYRPDGASGQEICPAVDPS